MNTDYNKQYTADIPSVAGSTRRLFAGLVEKSKKTAEKMFPDSPGIVDDIAEESGLVALLKWRPGQGAFERSVTEITETICEKLKEEERGVGYPDIQQRLLVRWFYDQNLSKRPEIFEQLPYLVSAVGVAIRELPDEERQCYELWLLREKLKSESDEKKQKTMRGRVSYLSKKLSSAPKRYAELRFSARKHLMASLEEKMEAIGAGVDLIGSIFRSDESGSSDDQPGSKRLLYRWLTILVRLVLFDEASDFLEPILEEIPDLIRMGSEPEDSE